NDLSLWQPVLNRLEAAARRHFTFKDQLFVVGVFKRKRGDTGTTRFVRAQISEDGLRGFRLLGQNQLQVMSKRVFDGNDILVGNADAVRQRADDRARLAQRR